MKNLLFALSLLLSGQLFAQHPTPVDMLFNPSENIFQFSGAGGGNLYGLFKASGAASGVLALDANYNLKEKVANGRKKINTIALNFKVHPFINTLLEGRDSLDFRKLAFQDNDFRLQFGARYTMLSEKEKKGLLEGNSKRFAQAFIDVIVVPYQIEESVSNQTGFTSLSLNMGGKFGILRKIMGGTFGITANPQLDLLFILDQDMAFEEAFLKDPTANQLANMQASARAFAAAGLKIEVPLNDFMLTFDVRRYYKLGEGAELEGLTDRTLFSVGGVAMGSIFSKKKKSKSNKRK